VNFGNNVHINLQTDTRAETQKLFKALSTGGVVSMELQDMFWGDYFGSCTDKIWRPMDVSIARKKHKRKFH
jgi:PhnB protein